MFNILFKPVKQGIKCKSLFRKTYFSFSNIKFKKKIITNLFLINYYILIKFYPLQIIIWKCYN